MKNIKDPVIINNFFSNSQYALLMNKINLLNKNSWEFNEDMNRYLYRSQDLDKLSYLNLERARKIFKSKTLLPAYSLLSLYNRKDSEVFKHKDNNACTYTFDICLYSEKPWPIVIEDKEYILEKNEAVCFYGEDQWHYRPKMGQNNKVLMLFMHWAEPDHIFFKQGWSI